MDVAEKSKCPYLANEMSVQEASPDVQGDVISVQKTGQSNWTGHPYRVKYMANLCMFSRKSLTL